MRAELRSWRRAHLDALTHEDVVGLVFEELLPSVLSQLVVLKERSKVLSALGVCASVFFMCGDLFSSIGVALKLVFARSIFGTPASSLLQRVTNSGPRSARAALVLVRAPNALL